MSFVLQLFITFIVYILAASPLSNDTVRDFQSALNFTVFPILLPHGSNVLLTWAPSNLAHTVTLIATSYYTFDIVHNISLINNGSYILSTGQFNESIYNLSLSDGFEQEGKQIDIFYNFHISITKPNSSFVFLNEETAFPLEWTSQEFPAFINGVDVYFLDLYSQHFYDYGTVVNNGSVFINLSSLELPSSIYAVYILGFNWENNIAILHGDNSDPFLIIDSPLLSVARNPITPGTYISKVLNYVSSGNSTDSIIYSGTGLNVSIDNSGPIFPYRNLLAAWTPAANLCSYNATLIFAGVSNASLAFISVNVTDNGSASVSISSFGESSLGFYELLVDGTLGSGLSLSFPIAAVSPPNVTLSSNSSAVNSTINFTWTPFDTLGTANISLIRLSNKTLIPVASNITDDGSLLIQLDYAPGAYLVIVNTSIGNGSSSILEITTPLFVSVSPSSISSAGESTNVTWTPLDTYQVNVSLIVSNGSNIVSNTSVPNTGSYSLTLDISSGLYNVTVVSDIGSGSADLNVYLSTCLLVTSSSVTSILYTNTTDAPFAWSPSGPSTGNVVIALTDFNTNQTFNLTVSNTRSASVNMSALDLSPSAYQAITDSTLGPGLSSNFVIQANAFRNVSDIGLLNILWAPGDLAKFNVTITPLDPGCPSTTYQFSSIDNGNSTINPNTPIATIDDPLQLSRRINDLERENKELITKIETCKRTITRLRVERNVLLEKLSEDGISIANSKISTQYIDPDLAQMTMECSPENHVSRIAAPPIAVYNYPTETQNNDP